MVAHLRGSRRTLLFLSLASFGWAFSFGLGAPLSSLWLKDARAQPRSIGLNTSVYYLGVALASPLVPWLMRRANRSCVVVGMLLDAITTAIFPWCQSSLAWHLVRLIGGVGTALSLVPMETLVNRNAAPEHRARDFGVYAFCVATGIALGAVVGLQLYPVLPQFAFAVGGLVTFLAVALAWWGVPARCEPEEAGSDVGGVHWRAGSLSFGTAWAQGFLEGGTLTFLTIYLLSLGHGEVVVSGLMGGFAGVIVAQLPLAWLADRVGRLRVLLLCHALVLAGLICVPCTQPIVLLGGWLFLLGACCGALYPLGLAFLGERVPPAGLAKANAWYLASNCAGSLLGPVLIGVAIDAFGQKALFVVGALAIGGVLLGWGLLRGGKRFLPEMRARERRAA